MPRISQQTLESIKNKISLSQFISRYADVKHKRGSDYSCCCPFHDEKTPSFIIHDDKQFFHCFGCGVSGDIFKFVQLYDHLSWYESVIKVAEEVGEPISFDNNSKSNVNYKKKTSLYSLYDRSRIFMNNLLQSPMGSNALAYLTSRNINQQMIEKFSLGYLPIKSGFLFNSILKNSDYNKETLEKSGIFYNNSQDSLFDGRLVFPVRTWDGKTVAFSARDLTGNSKAKYRNSPETLIYSKKSNLFGIYESLEALKKIKKVIICEGNFDVIALHQANINYSVASLGTAFTVEQARLLSRYVDEAYILFDNDEAGIKASIRTLSILQAQGISNYVINFENFNDPAELLEKKGEVALKKALTNYEDGFLYLVNTAKKSYDIKNSKGKDEIYKFVKPYIDATSSEIEKDALLQQLSQILNVKQQSVVSQYVREQSKKRNYDNSTKKQIDIYPLTKDRFTFDLYIMLIIANNRNLYKSFKTLVSINDIYDKEAISLFNILEDYFRLYDEDCSNDYFLQLIQDPQIRADVSSSFYMEEFNDNNCKTQIDEGLKRFKLRKLKKQRSDYEKILEIQQSSGDMDSIKLILNELNSINKEIANLKGNITHIKMEKENI